MVRAGEVGMDVVRESRDAWVFVGSALKGPPDCERTTADHLAIEMGMWLTIVTLRIDKTADALSTAANRTNTAPIFSITHPLYHRRRQKKL